MQRLISIKATKFDLTEGIKDYVFKKITSLEKFIHGYDENAKIAVEVSRTTLHHKSGDIYRAEVLITPPHSKKGLRATAEETDIYKAIDKIKDEVKRELVRHGGRLMTEKRRGGQKIKQVLRRGK